MTPGKRSGEVAHQKYEQLVTVTTSKFMREWRNGIRTGLKNRRETKSFLASSNLALRTSIRVTDGRKPLANVTSLKWFTGLLIRTPGFLPVRIIRTILRRLSL